MASTRSPLALVLACALAASCRTGRAPDEAPGANRHALKGTVVEVDASAASVTLAHEEIKGFMPAMTMSFAVRDAEAALVRTMAKGDTVSATLVVADSRSWLESVVVTRPPSPVAVPSGAALPRQPQPGDFVPDVALVDQSGRPLRLAEYRGRAYALTFVFTRCPMPEFCPFLMRGFAGAHEALVADASLARKTALVTVSFDVAYDTPKVLLAYGRPFQKTEPPFSHWRLATGRLDEVRTLGAALGLLFSEEDQSFSHNLRTAIVGPDGRLRRLFTGNDWTSAQIVAELTAALGG